MFAHGRISKVEVRWRSNPAHKPSRLIELPLTLSVTPGSSWPTRSKPRTKDFSVHGVRNIRSEACLTNDQIRKLLL